MKKEEINQIKLELRRNDLSITDIAALHHITPATVHNINQGRSYHDAAIEYPIRSVSIVNRIPPEKIAFINKYKHLYKPLVMSLIIDVGYETVLKYYAAPLEIGYEYNDQLEFRRRVIDKMSKPREELIHDYGDLTLTWEDAVYFKFLYTINRDEAAIIWAYKKWLDQEFVVQNYPITASIEELRRYLEWDGSKSKLIWFIRGIGNGKIKSIQTIGNTTKDFYYNDFDITLLRPYMSKDEFNLAQEFYAALGGNKRIF